MPLNDVNELNLDFAADQDTSDLPQTPDEDQPAQDGDVNDDGNSLDPDGDGELAPKTDPGREPDVQSDDDDDSDSDSDDGDSDSASDDPLNIPGQIPADQSANDENANVHQALLYQVRALQELSTHVSSLDSNYSALATELKAFFQSFVGRLETVWQNGQLNSSEADSLEKDPIQGTFDPHAQSRSVF